MASSPAVDSARLIAPHLLLPLRQGVLCGLWDAGDEMSWRWLSSVAFVLALLLAPALQAQEVPEGSYLASCQNAKIRGGRDLAAVCSTRGGDAVVSLLEDFASCTGDIGNKDGQLVCARGSSLYGFGSKVVATPPREPGRGAAVQSAPAGAYLSSCREARVAGGALKAMCQDRYGRWAEKTLALESCAPGSDIQFDDDVLSCRRPRTDTTTAVLPRGPYLETCRDISINSGLLQATCRTVSGGWQVSSYYAPFCEGRGVVNDDGRLACAPRAPRSADEVPPPGSYLSSCQEVTFSTGAIRARCRDRDGTLRTSTPLFVSSCPRGGDIYNDNGTLRCGMWGNTPSWGERPPRGSYMATCRDIRVTAGWLKATCQDRNGRWREATTAVSWCSGNRDIANIDGQLTCR